MGRTWERTLFLTVLFSCFDARELSSLWTQPCTKKDVSRCNSHQYCDQTQLMCMPCKRLCDSKPEAICQRYCPKYFPWPEASNTEETETPSSTAVVEKNDETADGKNDSVESTWTVWKILLAVMVPVVIIGSICACSICMKKQHWSGNTICPTCMKKKQTSAEDSSENGARHQHDEETGNVAGQIYTTQTNIVIQVDGPQHEEEVDQPRTDMQVETIGSTGVEGSDEGIHHHFEDESEVPLLPVRSYGRQDSSTHLSNTSASSLEEHHDVLEMSECDQHGNQEPPSTSTTDLYLPSLHCNESIPPQRDESIPLQLLRSPDNPDTAEPPTPGRTLSSLLPSEVHESCHQAFKKDGPDSNNPPSSNRTFPSSIRNINTPPGRLEGTRIEDDPD